MGARAARRQKETIRVEHGTADRKALMLEPRPELLLGTALASTLLLGALAMPTPAAAQVTCAAFDGTGPAPIDLSGTNDSIECVNTEARTGDPYAVQLSTVADNQSIELNTIGTLTASGAGEAFGIFAETDGANSGITIDNAGNVISTGDGGMSDDAYAIYARANGAGSTITIDNTGDLAASAAGNTSRAHGIYAFSSSVNNTITIDNTGDLAAITNGDSGEAFGIYARTGDTNSDIAIDNTGNIMAAANGADAQAYGIRALATGTNSNIAIDNSGDIAVATDGDLSEAYGIFARTTDANSNITVDNSGDIAAAADGGFSDAYGIYGATNADNSNITIYSTGDIAAVTDGDNGDAFGIFTETDGANSGITIDNAGDITIGTGGPNSDGYGIRARTTYANSNITINNTGDLTVTVVDFEGASDAYGIKASTFSADSAITIRNAGDIMAITTGVDAKSAYGIYARAFGTNSDIVTVNTGDITATGSGRDGDAYGIIARSTEENSTVIINNTGDITTAASGDAVTSNAYGIFAEADDPNSTVTVHNTGDITAAASGDNGRAYGIFASTGEIFFSDGDNSPITIFNAGDISAIGTARGYGIFALGNAADSPIAIENTGDITAATNGLGSGAVGIFARTYYANSPITIDNTGDITVEATGPASAAAGIVASTRQDNSATIIDNTGDIVATAINGDADGILANSFNANSSTIAIRNRGDIHASSIGNEAFGIRATTNGPDSDITIDNAGDITATAGGDAAGISAFTFDLDSAITIHNTGDITATAIDGDADGIFAIAFGTNNPITIKNSGDIEARAGGYGYGINAIAFDPDSPIRVENAGSVFGSTAGIRTFSPNDANPTTIVNTGDISAGSHLAINVNSLGTATIFNAGRITGFVDLTEQNDLFINESGGVFKTKQTSLFGGGDDLFDNQAGGTVLAATDGSKSETSSFVHLETFKNAGLISMVDSKEGDAFAISNTPGGTDLDYKGGGTLGVDAFLGGPGSKSDIFTIEGNVSGKTKVAVYNTNPGGGVFNDKGIPVVFATGETPDANAFRLADGPIDTGFFDYDLFFEGGGSGQWELRSFAGGGAHLLPQLLTAAQDIWHQSSSTWFDRTADLRVLMHGGPAPADLGGKSLAAPVQDQLSPAVWLKGGGSWLDRDANASTRAYGRNYNFNLDRDLETVDIQVGIDMGTRDLIGAGDALVFGVLGGFVHGDLDYDGLARQFDYTGGQVGAYATYLSGGLFVDTLLNVHLTELDTNTRGFAGSVDANTVGLRTDAGYRFGSFSGGAFIEPLGTIEVMWADIDGFAQDGNRVSFDDEANVRGRLGLRAGTTSEVWDGTLMEPFIIGSLWGNLSGDNQATLVSSGRTFQFVDDPEDVWGEVSAGVNFFNFSQTTSVFGKVDVTFGDDVTGLGGKAGMRVAW